MTTIGLICLFLLSVTMSTFPHADAASGSDSWPMFGYDVRHSRYTLSDAPETNHLSWSYQTDDVIHSSPAIDKGKLYVGSDDNYVYCLDAETGSLQWKTNVGGDVWGSSPAVANELVYIGAGSTLTCLDANDGSFQWNYYTGNPIDASPIVNDGKVFISSWSKKIYCLDADPSDGTDEGYDDPPEVDYDFIWVFETGNLIDSSPAVYDKKVYVGSNDNILYCLDALGDDLGSTDIVWSYQVQGDVLSSPAIADGNVYIGSRDNNVYCFYANNGTLRWSYVTNGDITSSPAIAYGNVFIGSDDKRLYCLDAETGLLAWSTPFVANGFIRSSPAVADNKVYVGSSDKTLYCIDASVGTQLWKYTTGGTIDSSPAIYNDGVYVGSSDHSVYCFKDEQELAPPAPDQPLGATTGFTDITYAYSVNPVEDPNGDPVSYNFDWGDGTNSGWITVTSAVHSWTAAGQYEVKVKAQDDSGITSDWSPARTVTIAEQEQPSQLLSLIIINPATVFEGDGFQVTVTDADDNAISNVLITFNGQTMATSTNGQVDLIAPLVNDDTEYFLIASKTGYQDSTSSITVLDQKTPLNGYIAGTVYSSTGLQGAQVCVNIKGYTSICTLTDASGEYLFSLPSGIYLVTVTKQGYTSSSDTITVESDVTSLVNFELTKVTTSNDGSVEEDIIERLLETEISNGNIGGRITITQQEESVSLYNTDLTIDLGEKQQDTITFTVGAAEGTLSEIIAIQLEAQTLSDISNLQVSYDENEIEKISFIELFSIEGSETKAKYTSILAYDGNGEETAYILFYIPHFSEHTITISSVAELVVIGGLTALALYMVICLLGVSFFVYPVFTGLVRRTFRRKTRKP